MGKIKIFVKSLLSRRFTMEIFSSDLVEYLKKLIQETKGSSLIILVFYSFCSFLNNFLNFYIMKLFQNLCKNFKIWNFTVSKSYTGLQFVWQKVITIVHEIYMFLNWILLRTVIINVLIITVIITMELILTNFLSK